MSGAGNPNVYQQSAGAYQGALGGTAQAMGGPDIGAFMNPYTQAVASQTMGDLERQRQMAGQNTAAQAQAAGAFGGSRHGVADALTNEAFARQGAQALAGLNQQGFNTALSAAQNQQQIGMQGASQLGQLAGQGFGFGQQIGNQQAQQGAFTQGLNQAVIDAAKGQFSGYTGAPMQSAGSLAGLLGATQPGQTTTQSQQPGLFNYLSLAML